MVGTTVLIILFLAADRVTKVAMEGFLADGRLVELIPGVLGLRLLHGGNTGAAFGILSGSTWLLMIITGIVLIGMLYVLYIKKLRSKTLHFATILIAAGGIGNLYDRIVYGAVTDFFEFQFMNFAIFNLADTFICVGAGLALLYVLFSKKDEPLFAAPAKGDKPAKDNSGDGHADSE